MNILEALGYGIKELSSLDNPRLDASILLKHSSQFTDLDLLINQDKELSNSQEDLFKELIKRRSNNEPVAYLTGEKEFYGLNFKVNEHTLIPRPDTELLIDHVLQYIQENNIKNPKILDLGTGSGAIIVTLLANIKDATGFAVDINPGAIAKATENAELNNVKDRLEFIQSSWFSNVKESDFDIIVANPPYITSKMMSELDKDVKDFEPNLALEGGALGYEPYIEIVENSPTFFKNKGRIFLEIGFDQQQTVLDLFKSDFWQNKKCFKDLGNNDRLIVVDFLKK
jgi:release factor glutamine methyltransferase